MKTAAAPARPSDFESVATRLSHLFAYVEKHLPEGALKEHVLDEVVNISKQMDRAVERVKPHGLKGL